MTVLVTGAAGFIGFHTSLALLDRGEDIVGIDNVNDYYDVQLKEARLKALSEHDGFTFERLDIADREAMGGLIAKHGGITRVIQLAAQAGVRHSLVDPYAYTRANAILSSPRCLISFNSFKFPPAPCPAIVSGRASYYAETNNEWTKR